MIGQFYHASQVHLNFLVILKKYIHLKIIYTFRKDHPCSLFLVTPMVFVVHTTAKWPIIFLLSRFYIYEMKSTLTVKNASNNKFLILQKHAWNKKEKSIFM